MNAEEATLTLISSMAKEAQMIMLAQSYLRGDHRLTYGELLEEIEHSKARRYSLGATQSEIMIAGAT